MIKKNEIDTDSINKMSLFNTTDMIENSDHNSDHKFNHTAINKHLYFRKNDIN